MKIENLFELLSNCVHIMVTEIDYKNDETVYFIYYMDKKIERFNKLNKLENSDKEYIINCEYLNLNNIIASKDTYDKILWIKPEIYESIENSLIVKHIIEETDEKFKGIRGEFLEKILKGTKYEGYIIHYEWFNPISLYCDNNGKLISKYRNIEKINDQYDIALKFEQIMKADEVY